MSRGLPIFLLVASAAFAEDARFVGPQLGYIFDPTSRQIRPLVGVPGAAVVATAHNGLRLDKAVFAGDGSIAIGYEAGGGRLVWTNPSRADAGATAIPDSLASFDLAALSRGATSAIVYAQACNCVQILTDLRNDPKVQRTVALPEGASVRALAINDEASVFVIADGSGKLVMNTPDFASELSISTNSIAFSPDGSIIAAVDDARKTVALISNLKTSPELVEIASERDGLKQPAAVGFVTASKLLVADKDSLVHVVDLALGSVQPAECACTPELIQSTADPKVYRLTDAGAGPVWIFEIREDSVRTLFVPVQRDSSEEVR